MKSSSYVIARFLIANYGHYMRGLLLGFKPAHT